MTPSRLSPTLSFLLGLLVLVGAAGVRYWYLNQLAHPADQGAWRVQVLPALDSNGKSEADQLVDGLAEGGLVQGFRGPAPLAKEAEQTAHVMPLFPLYRYAVEKLLANKVGFSERPGDLLRWSHLLLGSLTALLVFLIATRAFQSRFVGILAGIAAALYPFWIVATASPFDGVLATFLVALSLYLAIRAGQQGGALTGLLLGIVLSATALTRAALLPFAFALLLWYLWRSRRQSGGWLFGLVAFLGFSCGLASWGVRCYQQLGEPVPLVTSAWWHLWVGNNPAATGGPVTPEMLAQLPEERRETLSKLPQAQRYPALAADVLQEVEDHPYPTLVRRAKAMMLFFLGTTEPKRTNLLGYGESARPDDWLFNALAGTLFGMFLLAGLGWRWSYGWKSSTAPLALAVIWIPLPYLIAHAEPLHGPRLPLDTALIVLAAMAFACLLPGIGGRLLRGEAALAADATRS